jgi:ribosomal protein L18E
VAAVLEGQGQEAANLRVAEQWVHAWEKMASESNTIIVPASVSDDASMVTQALTIAKSVNK